MIKYIILGFVLFADSTYLMSRKHLWLKAAYFTTGEVIAVIPVQTIGHGRKGVRTVTYTYDLKVRYCLPDGSWREWVSSESFLLKPTHQLGEKVLVAYSELNDKARIVSFPDLYLTEWALLCIGVAILAGCVGWFVDPSVLGQLYLR
jgi:hypothetical protein